VYALLFCVCSGPDKKVHFRLDWRHKKERRKKKKEKNKKENTLDKIKNYKTKSRWRFVILVVHLLFSHRFSESHSSEFNAK
jgi:hypothetical protein